MREYIYAYVHMYVYSEYLFAFFFLLVGKISKQTEKERKMQYFVKFIRVCQQQDKVLSI